MTYVNNREWIIYLIIEHGRFIAWKSAIVWDVTASVFREAMKDTSCSSYIKEMGLSMQGGDFVPIVVA